MFPMSRKAVAAVALLLLVTVPAGAARQPVRARKGMAVAMEAQATDVGVAVLQKGGNAVDAAVAMGFAMAATHPFAGNLGGGGFMLIRFADGRSTFIDFREMAPGQATRNMYLDAKGELTRDSIEGWRSSGVPGTVRGFQMAVEKYGRKSWAESLAPAIQLAKGFPLSYALAESLKGSSALGKDPESKRIFQKGGAFFDVGDTLAQPELAATLAANGRAAILARHTCAHRVDELMTIVRALRSASADGTRSRERDPLFPDRASDAAAPQVMA